MLTITAGYRLVGGTIRLTKPTRPMRRHDNDRDLHLLIESRDAFVLFGYSVLKEDSMIKPRIMTFALREKENPKTALSTRPWSEGGQSRAGCCSVGSRPKNSHRSSPGINRSFQMMAFLAFLLVAVQAELAHAVTYNASKIIAIAVGSHGEVYIRWDGLPDPGPCGGENNHWVVIPATASDTLKSLALSVYFSGKAARIDTAAIQGTAPPQQPPGACTGAYENVTVLYSPSGG